MMEELSKKIKVYSFKSVDSTNKLAREYPPGSIIVSDEQTKGRGRFSRSWSSEKGGLYISIVVSPSERQGYLTFIAAISVQEAIKKTFSIETKVKWPNDVLYSGKKVCGILSEGIFLRDKSKMIIGIGINTNNKIPKSLSRKAISLQSIKDKKIDNEKLLISIKKEFEKYYNKYQNKKYKEILENWKKVSDTLGRKLRVKTRTGTYTGIAINVDKDCNLIIKTNKGNRKIIEGDIQVIK